MVEPRTTSDVPGSNILACVSCGERRHFTLDNFQQAELFQRHETRIFCPHCQEVTTWYALDADRRGRPDRRDSRHIKLDLPVRLRCQERDCTFVEVTHTLNAARDGCLLYTQKPLRAGMYVYLIMPYHAGADDALPETRAEVMRVEEYSGGKAVAVRFLR